MTKQVKDPERQVIDGLGHLSWYMSVIADSQSHPCSLVPPQRQLSGAVEELNPACLFTHPLILVRPVQQEEKPTRSQDSKTLPSPSRRDCCCPWCLKYVLDSNMYQHLLVRQSLCLSLFRFLSFPFQETSTDSQIASHRHFKGRRRIKAFVWGWYYEWYPLPAASQSASQSIRPWNIHP